MTAILLVSVINYYHIKGLHLYWNTKQRTPFHSFASYCTTYFHRIHLRDSLLLLLSNHHHDYHYFPVLLILCFFLSSSYFISSSFSSSHTLSSSFFPLRFFLSSFFLRITAAINSLLVFIASWLFGRNNVQSALTSQMYEKITTLSAGTQDNAK